MGPQRRSQGPPQPSNGTLPVGQKRAKKPSARAQAAHDDAPGQRPPGTLLSAITNGSEVGMRDLFDCMVLTCWGAQIFLRQALSHFLHTLIAHE